MSLLLESNSDLVYFLPSLSDIFYFDLVNNIREYLWLPLLALYFYLFALVLVYLYTLTLSIIFKSLL